MQVSRGTVYLRGGTWTIGYTVGGRRIREAIGSNRQMAEAVLKKRIVEAIEDRHFDKRNMGRVPFSEFADMYMDRCISLLKSIKTERIRVLYWKRTFGNRPIGQITLSELQDWQAQKRAVNKPATINLMLGRLRHMFNRAIEWGMLDESPLRHLRFLQMNNARLRYLSIEECGKLLAGCGVDHTASKRFRNSRYVICSIATSGLVSPADQKRSQSLSTFFLICGEIIRIPR